MTFWKMILVLLFPGLLFAQSPTHFRVQALKVRGNIQEAIAEDLDQDGIKEIAVVHIVDPNSPRRLLTIFWPDPNSNYRSANSYELEVPAKYSTYDFGSLPGEKERVLLFLSKNSAEYYRWKNHQLEGPTRLLSFSSQLVQLPDSDRLLNYDFFYDWNRDDLNELLAFQIGEAEIFYWQGGKWKDNSLPLPFEVSYLSSPIFREVYPHSEFRVTYFTPSIYLADLEGDGKQEMFAVSRNKVWGYKLGGDGVYGSEPCLKLDLRIAPEELNPMGRPASQLSLQVTDLDGDRLADLISNHQQGTFFSQKSELKIFLGKDRWANPNNPAPKPGKTYSYDAWVFGPLVKDINADHRPDLIVPTVEMGMIDTVKGLVARDFPVTFRYYLANDRALPDLPTGSDRVVLHIDLGQGRMMGGIPNIIGDFNGDGVDDLVFGKSEKELVILIKDKNGQKTNLQETVQIPTSLMPYVEDLNGDHKSDLILTYSQKDPARKGEFNVLINQGNW